MRKAEWLTDYDMHNDKCFLRPQCPECYAPVHEYGQDEFRCISCHELIELDDEMKEWVRKRAGEKVTMEDCPDYEIEFDGKKHKMGCGGKKCVETHYIKNEITLEWQTAWGLCKNCGRAFIV